MLISADKKKEIKDEIIRSLLGENVNKIMIFGSFVYSDNPNDLDLAVYLNDNGDYFDVTADLRSKLRSVNRYIPLDVVPIAPGIKEAHFLTEIEKGEVIYERKGL